ncbi:MAG: PAS domain S-box protein [Deltaproteobacteria bacterium]|jgi:PAS domain S-box-containing protein|nr:PAS domain S-box protein [Deltaproteobacteria bacterium]
MKRKGINTPADFPDTPEGPFLHPGPEKASTHPPVIDGDLYKTLADSSQVGVYILQGRRFRFVNPHIREYAGYSEEEMLNMDPPSIIHPADRNTARKNAIRMLKGRRFSPYEFRIITKDGRVRWILETVKSIRYQGERAVLGNSMNTTEQKEARNRLEELEALESSILDAIPHAVVGLRERVFIFANNAVEQVFGWRPAELIGKNVLILYRNEADYDEIARRFYTALETRRTFSTEFPARRKDGREILCMMKASRIGATLRERKIVVTYEDITEQKRARQELETSREQLRNLSLHLQSIREEERTRIAREIHDELGQCLTALKMDIAWLGTRIRDVNTALAGKIDYMSNLIDGTIDTVHRISSDLRPGLLDDLGLTAAIEWQTQDFERRSGLPCQADLSIEDEGIDGRVATAVFRILQESLTNVARHAAASRVSVGLYGRNGTLVLEVADDGRGITQKQIDDPRSFGLIGMRERVHPWGGIVTISGKENRGTRVVVTVPLPESMATP